MPTRRLFLFPALVALLAASACREAKIVSYRVPKQAAPAAAAPADGTAPTQAADTPPAQGGAPQIAQGTS